MALNRREFLCSTALAGSASLLAGTAAHAVPGDALNTLFDTLFQESLRENPEGATNLGLDKGANADLAARLNDVSAAGIARKKALTADQLRRLLAFDASGLSDTDRVNYDTVVYTRRSWVRLNAFEFGIGSSPYAISQITGAYQDTPDFLDTKHRLENTADADAYLARLEAFAGQLDGDTAKLGHDVALGVVPPDFVIDLTLTQLNKTRAPVDQTVLVTSIARRAKDKGLPDSYAASAAKLYTDKIVPALDRQIAAVSGLRPRASHE
ncbi:MAG TPA: DUF885 family protein, partial [Rhizomicrobium sp.]|nr:DUF885 family protein [Rhizomicrobium sp.]